LRIPACSASIRATPDTAYDTGNFPRARFKLSLGARSHNKQSGREKRAGRGSASRGGKEGRRCVVSRALHFRPGLDLELDIGKKKRKKIQKRKEGKANFKKRDFRISGRKKINLSFSTLTKISNKMEKSVEFILKKENIPGQVFVSFFSIL
jgi:hypothetical protein